MAEEDPRRGWKPAGLGRCTECGNAYPVQQRTSTQLQPIGVAGSCHCGKTGFELCTDLENHSTEQSNGREE